jgi:hypothetical protein
MSRGGLVEAEDYEALAKIYVESRVPGHGLDVKVVSFSWGGGVDCRVLTIGPYFIVFAPETFYRVLEQTTDSLGQTHKK